MDKAFEIIGVLMPILSALASLFNHKARTKQADGVQLSPITAGVGSVLNVGALNIDKAIQLAKAVQAALPKKEEQGEKFSE